MALCLMAVSVSTAHGAPVEGLSAKSARPPAGRTTADALFQRAQALVAAGNQKAAIVVLERLCRKYPRHQASRRLLVKLYAWNNRGKDIPAILAQLVALRPKDDPLLLKLAQHLIWTGKACKTVPLYRRYLRRHPVDLTVWRRLAQVGGWCSRSDVAMAALEQVVVAAPKDWKAVELLAKLSLWNKRPARAAALLERLLRAHPKRHDLRWLLVSALLAVKRTAAGIRHLRRYLAAKPGDRKACYLLAQACHWRLCWPEARRAYERLLAGGSRHAKAAYYYRALRRARGHPLGARFDGFYDSNQVLRLSGQVLGGYRFGQRWTLMGHFVHHWIAETDRTDLDGDGRMDDRVSLYGDRGEVKVDFLALYNLRLSAWVGVAGFSTGRVEPAYGVSVFGSLWGRLFMTAKMRFGSHLNGVTPVVRGITFHELSGAVYAEPVKWLSVSAALRYSFFSDRNRRILVFSGVWFAPWRKPWLFKPGVTVGYDDFSQIYPTSDPYYTPDRIVVISPGLDVGWRYKDRFSVEAGYWLAVQPDGTLAHNPRVRLSWWMTEFSRLQLAYHRSGGAEYGFHLATIRFTYQF